MSIANDFQELKINNPHPLTLIQPFDIMSRAPTGRQVAENLRTALRRHDNAVQAYDATVARQNELEGRLRRRQATLAQERRLNSSSRRRIRMC